VSLGEVVAKIIASGSPRDCVVAESYSITDPEVTHINGFRALNTNCTEILIRVVLSKAASIATLKSIRNLHMTMRSIANCRH